MKYLIEIYKGEEIIKIKRAYTIEEIKTFYREEYLGYKYKLYEISNIDIRK